MRIISGKYKSRLLKAPANTDKIRPTMDRAKETLFNILSNKFDFENLTCLDLFCGTGNLGLECLSRGAKLVYFVDLNTVCTNENVRLLKAEEQSVVIKNDVFRFLRKPADLKFDLIFADPPYKFTRYDDLIKDILKYKSIFILEHSDSILFSDELKKYLYLQKKISITYFSFFDTNKE
jgi:16S rRNA (guanine966-N2)-methyltransferase